VSDMYAESDNILQNLKIGGTAIAKKNTGVGVVYENKYFS